MNSSPIFTKTYDMLLWLIPRTTSFPRDQRFVLARHVQDTALQFQEHLIDTATASRQDAALRRQKLQQADVALTKLRFYLRLCRDLGYFKANQHRHVSDMLAEIGRLLGGWQKSIA